LGVLDRNAENLGGPRQAGNRVVQRIAAIVAKNLSIRLKTSKNEGRAIMSDRPNAVSAGVTLL